jgi:Rrf2 family cysteine metabolism transcriptional repressor
MKWLEQALPLEDKQGKCVSTYLPLGTLNSLIFYHAEQWNAMLITQKKQYALRAIYELAKHQDERPLKSAEIAQAQSIPQRFLEIILNRLKHAGIVVAKRGYTGGFLLNRPADDISVKEIFQALDESCHESTACVSCILETDCPFSGRCAFMPLWSEIQAAIDQICGQTTIKRLVDNQAGAETSLK